MGYILRLCNNLSLNKETKLDVFDTYVSSVLNYGCEVSFHPPNNVENMHRDFCKGILNVKKATINVVVFTSGKTPSSYCTKN